MDLEKFIFMTNGAKNLVLKKHFFCFDIFVVTVLHLYNFYIFIMNIYIVIINFKIDIFFSNVKVLIVTFEQFDES